MLSQTLNQPEAKTCEPKTGDIEAMCGRISDLRKQAGEIQVTAREIEHRLLGPLPEGEGGEVNQSPVASSLTGIVAGTSAELRESLDGITCSLDRIYRELGSIGL